MFAKKSKKESESTPPQNIEMKNAIVVPQELAQELFAVLNELPIKYGEMVVPIMAKIQKCHVANVKLDNPKKVPPAPSAVPEKEEKK